MARPKTLRPADFAVMTTAVLLNVRHDLATPADQHPMMTPGPVRVVHRGDVLAEPEISADTAPSPTPAVIAQDPEPLHQHCRLAMLRRVPNDDSLPLRARGAAALVLLYAQPVSRIVRLTIDDETTVTVQLGDPPSPLPEPVASLMRAYIQSRQHLPHASSRSSQWLFSGRQPGQPDRRLRSFLVSRATGRSEHGHRGLSPRNQSSCRHD
ncbi:hypothetical protein [Streptomyces lincolnensis]|uniref:hypothetical protein n=1 Tax=Streptomyces lincolnensis TaxID=1915 RepID=UPI0037D94FDA